MPRLRTNTQPYNTSPYLPQCSLYRNFIYLDVERVGESPLTESISPEIETLRAGDLVEYESVAGLKMRALRVLFERFSKAGGSPDFDRYVESEGARCMTSRFFALWMKPCTSAI